MNETGDGVPRRRGGRRYRVVLGLVVVVVVAWSAVWFAVASVFEHQLDVALAAADGAGTAITCENRRIDGYPFRLELRCEEGSRIISPDLAATLGGITGVALVYDPRRLILEAASPVAVEAPVPALAEWTLAHASVELSRAGAEEMRLEIEELAVTSEALFSAVTADLAGLYVRPDPAAAADLDVGLKLTALEVVPGALPVDVRGRVVVAGAAPALSGDTGPIVAALANGGVPVTIDELLLTAEDATVSLGGMVTVRPDGLLDGKVDVALALPASGLPDLKIMPAEQRTTLSRALDNVLSFAPRTMIGDTPARKVTLTIRSGRVSAGFVPLGRIPPIGTGG